MRMLGGGLIESASGSLGSVAFKGGRTGIVVCSRARPGVRTSSFRARHRQLFAAASKAWAALSPELRQAWTLAVSEARGWTMRGPMRPRSGQSYFVAQAVLQMSLYQAIENVPPVGGDVVNMETLETSMSEAAGEVLVSWVPTPISAGRVLVVSVAAYPSAGSRSSQARWFSAVALEGPLESPLALSVAGGIMEAVGRAGQAYGLRVAIYDVASRHLGMPLVARAIVTV